MSNKVKTWLFKGGIFIAVVLLFIATADTWFLALKILTLACIFTLLIAPVSTKLERRGMKKGTAALLSILICILALALFLLVFVPYLLYGILDFAKRIAPTILSVMDRLNAELLRWGIESSIFTNPSDLFASILTPLTTTIAKGSAAFFSAAGKVIFSLVITYYLLTIRTSIARHLLLFIPPHMRQLFLSALSGCKNAAMSYLSGTIKTCAFVGAATLVGLLILGIDDAFILSFFMSILEIMPYVGPVLASIPIVIAAIPLGTGKTIAVLLLIVLIQQIEGTVIGPYFTASSTSIHPLAVVSGVFLGGSLFGIPGVLFTVPLMIVARSMFWSIRSAAIQLESINMD